MDLTLDEAKHVYWDEFLTELAAVCKKHHVILEAAGDAEIIATSTETSFETLNLGYAITAKNLDDMLKS